MTDCARPLYSLISTHLKFAARLAVRFCLSVFAWTILPCITLPAMAGYIQANVPKLSASDPIGLAKQGFSVAVSADGNTALVGGPFDDSGVGAAWIFTRGGGVWTRPMKLTGSGMSGAAQFGWSVALSADGNTALVGGPGDNDSAGATWVFARTRNGWIQQAKLFGAGALGNAEQGYSLALSDNGNIALVGGWADSSALGAAWVFRRRGSNWSQHAKLVGTGYAGGGKNGNANVMQGFSVALSGDGKTALIGGPGDSGSVGAAWVFVRGDSGWSQPGAKLSATPGLCNAPMQGFSVALDATGVTAIVGGPNDQTTNNAASASDCPTTVKSTTSTGAAWIWTLSGGNGSPAGGTRLAGTPADNNPGQGYSVALGGDGHTALVGGPTDNANTGAAWVFTSTNGSQWTQGDKLIGTGAAGAAGQASSVALSRDGTTAILGGPLDHVEIGAAWVFVTQAAGLSVSLTGSGSVTSSPSGINCGSTCDANFGNATNVSLTATPPSGWGFAGWSGACSGSGSSCKVTMISAETVSAIFKPLYTLTISDSGSGTVSSNPSNVDCQTSCGASFLSGTQVSLTATAQSGYRFMGWSGACSGTGNCVVTMSTAENKSHLLSDQHLRLRCRRRRQPVQPDRALPDIRRHDREDRPRWRDRLP